MLAALDGFRSSLRKRLIVSDTTITIPRADAIKLNAVGVGNHTYLTIKDRTRSEIVRYDHTADWDAADPAEVAVPVTRNANGLGIKNFAYGSCVMWEINSSYLNDLIAGMFDNAGVAPPTSEDPAIPTTMVGGRGQSLGQPDGYVTVGGKSIPYYTP